MSEARLFTGAKVFRHGFSIENAFDEVLVVDGKIHTYGYGSSLSKTVPSETVKIQLDGGFLLPPFFDGHVHLDQGGRYLDRIWLHKKFTSDNVIERLKENRAKDWILGIGLQEEAIPSLKTLDSIFPDKPVVLYTKDYHSVVINSYLANSIELTPRTAFKEGGWQELDDAGNITGILRENAILWLEKKLPDEKEADLREHLMKAADYLLHLGVLGVSDSSHPKTWPILKEMENDWPLYTEQWVRCSNLEKEWLNSEKYASKKLRRQRLKLFADGALGSKTAWMKSPYINTENVSGNPAYPKDQLDKFISAAKEKGWSIAVHAIGDAAVEYIVSKIASCQFDCDTLPRVEHFQHVTNDILEKFSNISMIASIQPLHRVDDQAFIAKRLSKDVINNSFPAIFLASKNKRQCVFGTDWPVVDPNPFKTIAAALHRRVEGEGMLNQHFSPEEALYAYSRASAIAAGFLDFGKTEQGFDADFVWTSNSLGTSEYSWETAIAERIFMNGYEI